MHSSAWSELQNLRRDAGGKNTSVCAGRRLNHSTKGAVIGTWASILPTTLRAWVKVTGAVSGDLLMCIRHIGREPLALTSGRSAIIRLMARDGFAQPRSFMFLARTCRTDRCLSELATNDHALMVLEAPGEDDVVVFRLMARDVVFLGRVVGMAGRAEVVNTGGRNGVAF